MQKIVKFWKSGAVGKIVVIVGLLLLVCICCSAFSLISTSSPTYKATATARAAVRATELAKPTNTLSPTETPMPTNTLGPTATSRPTNTPLPTNTLGPTETPRPTETPQPTLSPSEILHQSIIETLGTGNRDVERLSDFEAADEIFIQWTINDNLTEDMIKGGAQIDVTDMLKTIAHSDITYDSVRLHGTFPLVDKYGNVTETAVVKVVYTADTIQKINWDNFIFKNVYDIADSMLLHPAFQK